MQSLNQNKLAGKTRNKKPERGHQLAAEPAVMRFVWGTHVER